MMASMQDVQLCVLPLKARAVILDRSTAATYTSSSAATALALAASSSFLFLD